LAVNVVVDVLLTLGVVGEAVCVAGVLLKRTTFDRLHYLGASTTVPAFCFVAAVICRQHVSSGGLQAIAAVALLFLFFPVALLALARAARRVRYGEVRPRPEERVDG
jgi:multisubunit Na+/H+ antiporter MnhG subunit